MQKKLKKTREEKFAEDFFPVEPEDIKYSIEKKYHPVDFNSLIKIEKVGDRETKIEFKNKKESSKKIRKKGVKKTKSGKIKNKAENFRAEKISLNKEGYELIITEKPQAALKIASALGKSTKRNIGNVPYYEVNRKGEKIFVGCAVGHLFTLTQRVPSSKTPVFDLVWVPNYFVRKKDFSKKYYDVLLKLISKAGKLTIATDYDTEGEVIGLNIVRFAAGQSDANRMKFSTLTEKEINQAYETKTSSLDWGQAIAGETRHYLDWFYGINLSRALMNAIKTTGKFRIMSIGRVQGPALNLIVEKEKQIQFFKSQLYWQIFITLETPDIELIYNKDVLKKAELKKFENLVGKEGKAETKRTQQALHPNIPFNLTTLQTESYRLYGINPSKTLQIAQSLYLAGLISYPRTSSQKLPPSINYREILQKIAKKYQAEKMIVKEKPLEGKKSDSAHPSIYPTGNFKILSGDEKRIYDLISRRFLCLFMEEAIIENKTINVEIEGLIFTKKGLEIKKESWLKFYPKKIEEKSIPEINGIVKVKKSRIEEKETQPAKRYSPASIISELEKRNLGTKATRSSILDTLFERGYIEGQSIKATPLGMSLIDTLKKYSPIIIDEELTRNFEKEMGSVQNSKKNSDEKKEKIIERAKKTIIQILEQFEKKQKEIGKEIVGANDKLREQQKNENKLKTFCPVCKKGNLSISYSKKTRRSFVACNAYPNCKNTYSLPPNGLIKKSEEICDKCGFQKLMLIQKGRRPWIFCFNRECSTNKERIEAYRNRQAGISYS